MAVWQFDFYLIEESFKDIKAEPCFKRVKQQSLNEISKVLPRGESWSKNIIIYGDIDSTCLKFFYEDNELQDVSIRLDLRNLNKDILIEIVKFIKSNQAKILDYEAKKIIEPTIENLIESIKQSEAYRFCKNPEQMSAK